MCVDMRQELAGVITTLITYSLLLTDVRADWRPNIVVIVADDLGYHDVGYHGAKIRTPNIDRLAKEGVRLENYYVQPVCTPSRSQLMTGRYSIHTGLQHGVIMPTQPSALPLDSPTLADKLKEVGYTTLAVGKWHLGHYMKKYLPTRRGFDRFFGFYMGSLDHYTHSRCMYRRCAVDLHDDTPTTFRNVFNESGVYSTQLFTRKAVDLINAHSRKKPFFLHLAYQAVHTPLQVPKKYTKYYSKLMRPKRRLYAAMTTAMDEGVGQVVNAIKRKGLWKNTVLVFTTDNGANPGHGGSNFPLRGKKNQFFEGGIKGVAFVASPLLKVKNYINRGLMHVSDWFPTLIHVAGGNLRGTKNVSGVNQWNAISKHQASKRHMILHGIDPMDTVLSTTFTSFNKSFDIRMAAALRIGDYKLITGATNKASKHKKIFKPSSLVKLYHIGRDPKEQHNIAQYHMARVKEMLQVLQAYYKTSVPVTYPLSDIVQPRNSAWGPWR
uniref:Sulfatase N-terminal domain-containing protein n=2 Tax=Biomphalaria glabrata TaxID=6526 RepID=A0A2C9JJC2_BIOGL